MRQLQKIGISDARIPQTNWDIDVENLPVTLQHDASNYGGII